MFFDLTKKIILSKKNARLYTKLQAILYFSAFFLASYLAVTILFPSQQFEFSFNNSSAKSNTVTFVSIGTTEKLKHGLIETNEKLNFTASSPSFFSKASIQFELDKKSDPLVQGKISMHKSYQAFTYPAGNSAEISEYISTRNRQTLGDGSLVSHGNSIYVISNRQILPIDSPETFLSLGYAWKNVIPIDADQFSLYAKGSLITPYSAHPDGTVFQTDDKQKYIVQKAKKYLLPSDFNAIAAVPVSEKNLEITAECQIKKDIFTLRKYTCSLPLDKFQGLFGKDHIFIAEFSNNIQLQAINIKLKRDMTFSNFNISLNNLLKRSKENYVPTN